MEAATRPNLVNKDIADNIINSEEINSKFNIDNSQNNNTEYELTYLVNQNKINESGISRITEINNEDSQKSNQSNRSRKSNRSNRSRKSNRSNRSRKSNRSNRSRKSNRSNRSDKEPINNNFEFNILDKEFSDSKLKQNNIVNDIYHDIHQNNDNYDNNNDNYDANDNINIKDKEKIELLYKIKSLEFKGIKLAKSYDINSSYDEMKFEYDRLIQNKELENSIKIQEKMLMTFSSVVEFMNERYDPFDLKLTGWSESIHENLGEYKDIFGELHEKYKTKTKTPPEIRLLISVFGSAFMFHFSQTVLKLGVNNLGLGGLASMASNMASNNSGGSNAENGINLMQNIMGNQKNNNSKQMQGPSNIEELLKSIEKNNG